MISFGPGMMLPTASWYVKKPVRVRAVQIDEPFRVHTLHGVVEAKAGDFLVESINGDLYPCDKGIFVKTHELAQDQGKAERAGIRGDAAHGMDSDRGQDRDDNHTGGDEEDAEGLQS